jgi:hypothetical protein
METIVQIDERLARLKRFEKDLQYLADKTCIGNRPEAEAELVKIRTAIDDATTLRRGTQGRKAAPNLGTRR